MKRITSRGKRDNAITLIALVITIIVLLILAGITINSVIGSKGILNNAKKAANAYNKSATEENKVLDYYVNEIEKADNGNNTGPSSGSNPGSTGGSGSSGTSGSGSITYTDSAGKTQTLTKDTPAGTKIGTTANISGKDGETGVNLDWFLFDVSDDGKTAYVVSTPTYWVPDTDKTRAVNGALVPKLVSNYNDDTNAMQQAIRELENGINSHDPSDVTYTPSVDTWKYFKNVNSQWSAQRGNIDLEKGEFKTILYENEQVACYLADADIFAGIRDKVNNANGGLKGKIQTLVGGASIEQWCNAYNKQSVAKDHKITCEYSGRGYIYKVNGKVKKSGYDTNPNTIFGNDIFGAASSNITYGAANNNENTTNNPFYNDSWWWLASPSSYSSDYVWGVNGNYSDLDSCISNNSFLRLSLFASVAL